MREKIDRDAELKEVESLRLEDFPGSFSKMELLGLDEPRFEYRFGYQSILIPKSVYFFVRNFPESVEPYAQFFGLDIEKDNFGNAPRKGTEAIMLKKAILMLMGINDTDATTFFACSATKGQSPSLKGKKKQLDIEKQNFPIDYLEEIPEMEALFKIIEETSGIKPKDVYPPHKIPRIYDQRGSGMSRKANKQILLEESLSIITSALTGEYTVPMLAKKYKRPDDTLRGHLKDGVSEKMAVIIKSRLQNGLKNRVDHNLEGAH